jgi:hypothetical protein
MVRVENYIFRDEFMMTARSWKEENWIKKYPSLFLLYDIDLKRDTMFQSMIIDLFFVFSLFLNSSDVINSLNLEEFLSQIRWE